MWSKLKPAVSLKQWAETIGLNPYLVAQIGQPRDSLASSFGGCETPFLQGNWQGADRLGRDDIAQALLDAEGLVADFLQSCPIQREISEEIAMPREANLRSDNWYSWGGRVRTLKTRYGNLTGIGAWTRAFIANATPVLSNPMSDAFNTLATLTVTVPSGTLADELEIYFLSGDAPDCTQEERRITYARVTITGLTATITTPAYMLVKPSQYMRLVPSALDASDATIYASSIAVYRRTLDPALSGTLIWRLDDCVNEPCTHEETAACYSILDRYLGRVAPVSAEYETASDAFKRLYPSQWGAPDRVVIRYLSGPPASQGMIAAICKLATALLPGTKTAGCAYADTRLYYYRSLPLTDNGILEVGTQAASAAANAFGVGGRGAVEAFRFLQDDPTRVYRSTSA